MKNLFLLISLILPLISFSFEGMDSPESKTRFTLSGHIEDETTGEQLIGATVYVKEMQNGTVSNVYGFYSLSLEPGDYTFIFSFIGYTKIEKSISLKEDKSLNIKLKPSHETLEEVIIQGKASDKNIKEPEMGSISLDSKKIDQIPALMGEIDIIKAFQLLPGVQATSEGSSGFSVRGGAPDQNLILLDEAPVYNASHMLGFFSVFNNDAVKDVKLYKGDIPAQYGGRLASLMDVRMKEGNNKSFHGTGGIGLISSRLTLEGPIIKDKTSYLISGRRTYADLFLPLSSDDKIKDNKLHFYDLNAKVNHIINENNRIFISGYFGRDVFKNKFGRIAFGNQTATVRWNHLFSQRIFANFTGIYTNYDYEIGTEMDRADAFNWISNMKEYGLKADFTWFLNPDNTVRFGASTAFHDFYPGMAEGVGENSFFDRFEVPSNYALESSAYMSNEQNIGERISLRYGLRLSIFQNIGPATVYSMNNAFDITDSTNYAKGDFYNTYAVLQPRFGINFLLNESSSLKASYSRTAQYVQLAQKSASGTPLDVWFPASPNVKPQIADMVAVGYFKNFQNNVIETSIEAYYKNMQNSIDFKDFAQLLLNKEMEKELRFGKSWAYGIELLVRKNKGRLTGWVGYTYSRAERKFEDINNGNTYRSPYDKPHELTIVLNYELSQRITVSANWIYATGAPVTFPSGRAIYGNKIIAIYTERNSYRMPDYHRLDLALILKEKPKTGRKWHHSWTFSVYNAYGRKNAWAINFVQDADNPDITYAEKTYLFGIIPSVTFNFNF